MDAKATIKVGPFARRTRKRMPTRTADHDFQPNAMIILVGILLPATDELFLCGVTSKVTSDCLADCLMQWWERVPSPCLHIMTLLVDLDDGPENDSPRTQFMRRLFAFAHQSSMVSLCAQPIICPTIASTARSNAVGAFLKIIGMVCSSKSITTSLVFVGTMILRGSHLIVELVTTIYQTGVKLT